MASLYYMTLWQLGSYSVIHLRTNSLVGGRCRLSKCTSKGKLLALLSSLATGTQTHSRNIRLGEYTRGMCVVDRRQLPTPEPPPGEADEQGKISAEREHMEKIFSSIPNNKNEIFVITCTPGSDVLVQALFQHIWDAKRPHKPWYSRLVLALRSVVGM